VTDRPPRGLAIPVSCPCGASVLVRFGTGRDQLYLCENCGRKISIKHEVVTDGGEAP